MAFQLGIVLDILLEVLEVDLELVELMEQAALPV
jgi:hypothetical protein